MKKLVFIVLALFWGISFAGVQSCSNFSGYEEVKIGSNESDEIPALKGPKKGKSKHFVLIHGAWHGGWCWDEVKERLEKKGHSVEAITLPGNNPGDDRASIVFQDYIDAIVNAIKAQEGQVVLIAHSSAGLLVQAAAPEVSDKIEQLIFINAWILPNGLSQFNLLSPEVTGGMIAAAAASGDNSVPVDPGFVRNVLMPGESAEDQDELIAQLVPQSLVLFTTPVQTEAFDSLNVKKAVIFCQDDASLPPGVFLGMAQGLGEFDLIEIEGGHEAIFTDPKGVSKAILKCIKKRKCD